MKRIRKSVEDPKALKVYKVRFANRPTPPTWNEFKKQPERVGPVKCILRNDQRGLCAYCEIRLAKGNESVEHIVTRDSDHDRELDWQNLLLICFGGERTPPPKELSCGQARNRAGSSIVLNPLQIPAHEPLFILKNQTGELSADEGSCQRAQVDAELVRSSVINLGLNVRRLANARLRVLETIEEEVGKLVDAGRSFPEAEQLLAADWFQPNKAWPDFFTTVRCKLGEAAEERLRIINFAG